LTAKQQEKKASDTAASKLQASSEYSFKLAKNSGIVSTQFLVSADNSLTAGVMSATSAVTGAALAAPWVATGSAVAGSTAAGAIVSVTFIGTVCIILPVAVIATGATGIYGVVQYIKSNGII
jgi:hypothetical protein